MVENGQPQLPPPFDEIDPTKLNIDPEHARLIDPVFVGRTPAARLRELVGLGCCTTDELDAAISTAQREVLTALGVSPDQLNNYR